MASRIVGVTALLLGVAGALLHFLMPLPAVASLPAYYARGAWLPSALGLALGGLIALAGRHSMGRTLMISVSCGVASAVIGAAILLTASQPSRRLSLGLLHHAGEDCIVYVQGRLPGGRLRLQLIDTVAARHELVETKMPLLDKYIGKAAHRGELRGVVERVERGQVQIGGQEVSAIGTCMAPLSARP